MAKLTGRELDSFITRTLEEESNRYARGIHIVSFSYGDLLKNLGDPRAAKIVQRKIKSQLKKGIKSSTGKTLFQGKRIDPDAITNEDLKDLKKFGYMYAMNGNGSDVAFLASSYAVARSRLTAMSKHITEDLDDISGIDLGRDTTDRQSLRGYDRLEKEGIISSDTFNSAKNTIIKQTSKFKVTSKLSLSLKRNISKLSQEVTLLVPQDEKINRRIISSIENKAINELRKNNSIPINTVKSRLSKMLDGYAEKGKNTTSIGIADVSIFEESVTKKVSKSIKTSAYKAKYNKRKDSLANSSYIRKVIREANRSLHTYVRRVMKKGDPTTPSNLVYRSGRFANSASIEAIIVNPRSTTVVFNYMRNPYQVFDPAVSDSTLASKGRDPNRIIGKAIRDLLKSRYAEDFKNRMYTRQPVVGK